MKNKTIKLMMAVAGMMLLTFSCDKKEKLPQDTVVHHTNEATTESGGSNNSNSGCCKYKATGTIERCPLDSNLWFINVTSSACKINTIAQHNKLYVPVNLPQSFKQNLITVKFEFNLLPDSVKLDCWFCGTPPPPYAHYIKLCDIKKDSTIFVVKKPVIYLYPQKETKVKVELNYKGQLTVTYPDYNDKLHGWEVMAQKNGDLKNLSDNTEHQYLFWEGTPAAPYNFNMKEGYCIKGSDTKSFLQNKLPKLGLTPKEYNDMITFWLPQMMNNTYNIIHFAGVEYTKSAPLTITPKPDNLIRVFMAYQPSKIFVKTIEPTHVTPKRDGFTAVEWGGVELPQANNKAHLNF